MALLGARSRQRDLLIEHLHLIQDHFHQISAAHLAALADEMKLSFAEVFETATFYAHFDIVKDGEPPIPPLTVRVCDSLTCMMHGSQALHDSLDKLVGPGVRVVRAPCLGLCDQAPVAEVGHHFVHEATPQTVLATITAGDTHIHMADYVDYDAYRAGGGYRVLESLRTGERSTESILTILDDSGLRGLGGAGFPTGRKWRAVLGEPGPRLMAESDRARAALIAGMQTATRQLRLSSLHVTFCTPLEAQAAGKPVLAYADGGALETVVEGKSGCLFTDCSPEGINRVASQLEAMDWDPDAIRLHAESFAEPRFIKAMQSYVEEQLQSPPPVLAALASPPCTS